MPDEDNKILKYNHGEKSLKAPFMIYADLECLLEKMDSCKIILKHLTQRKKLSICLLAVHCLQIVHLMRQKISLIIIEAKIVWKFCKGLREHAMRILSYEKKKNDITDRRRK